ncbi:hypothetical protein BJ165DRAFT_239328 [Panaeolus papilionaceus]|nr:hypothetical protein BJ165DRAFT_239328 [Panaeolus papilionaceus]
MRECEHTGLGFTQLSSYSSVARRNCGAGAEQENPMIDGLWARVYPKFTPAARRSRLDFRKLIYLNCMSHFLDRHGEERRKISWSTQEHHLRWVRSGCIMFGATCMLFKHRDLRLLIWLRCMRRAICYVHATVMDGEKRLELETRVAMTGLGLGNNGMGILQFGDASLVGKRPSLIIWVIDSAHLKT